MSRPLEKITSNGTRHSFLPEKLTAIRHEVVNIYGSQTESIMLSKLSAELRIMIWEYAVGYRDLQISFYRNRLYSKECSPEIWRDVKPHTTKEAPICSEGAAFSESPAISNDASQFSQTRKQESEAGNRKWRALHILLSCKQIYNEAVNILYATNTFLFSSPFVVPTFYASLPLIYWQEIRTIKILCSRRVIFGRSEIQELDGSTGCTPVVANGSWHILHTLLTAHPKLQSCQVLTATPTLAHESAFWVDGDLFEARQEIMRFMTTRKCTGVVKGLEVFVPYIAERPDVTHNSENEMMEREWFVAHTRRQLKSRGVTCKVVVGGMLGVE